MAALLVTVQLFLLFAVIPLAAMSFARSRRRRQARAGVLGLAFLIGLAAVTGALVSLSLRFGSDEVVDPLLSFLPPLATLAACTLIAWRATRRRTRTLRRG
jgi:lipopolysaccharide export LptBFGC system permease protein LptF